jgi:hypothetical protein
MSPIVQHHSRPTAPSADARRPADVETSFPRNV